MFGEASLLYKCGDAPLTATPSTSKPQTLGLFSVCCAFDSDMDLKQNRTFKVAVAACSLNGSMPFIVDTSPFKAHGTQQLNK